MKKVIPTGFMSFALLVAVAMQIGMDGTNNTGTAAGMEEVIHNTTNIPTVVLDPDWNNESDDDDHKVSVATRENSTVSVEITEFNRSNLCGNWTYLGRPEYGNFNYPDYGNWTKDHSDIDFPGFNEIPDSEGQEIPDVQEFVPALLDSLKQNASEDEKSQIGEIDIEALRSFDPEQCVKPVGRIGLEANNVYQADQHLSYEQHSVGQPTMQLSGQNGEDIRSTLLG